MNNKNLTWLASYPKSGNTWLRVFLTNYLSNSDTPADINKLDNTPIFSSRQIFDEYAPFNSSDLSPKEIDIIRYDIFKEISNNSIEKKYFKIHDALYNISPNKFNIPIENTDRIIYLLRNPLDVVVSFANHSSISIEKSIIFLNNSRATLAQSKEKLDTQIRQNLFSWSKHVESWSKVTQAPILIVKYESILENQYKIFSEILNFLKIPIDESKINKAIQFSTFDELKKQETKNTFREKPSKAESFFRNGKSNTWEKVLNKKQIEQIINPNYDIMKKFLYI